MGSNAKKVSELWRDQCVQSMEVKLLCKGGNSCLLWATKTLGLAVMEIQLNTSF